MKRANKHDKGMCGSRKFCPRGCKFDNVFFLVHKGKKDSNTANKWDGPLSARQRNAIYSFVIFQGIRTSIATKPYIFVNFQGGGGPDPYPSSGSAHD